MTYAVTPPAQYTIYLRTSDGERLGIIENWVSLEYALVVNERTRLVLVLGEGQTIPTTCVPDGIIEVWRRLPGGREYLEGDKWWFIQTVTLSRDASGLVTTTIEAENPLWLFDSPGRYWDPTLVTPGGYSSGGYNYAAIYRAFYYNSASDGASDAIKARSYPNFYVGPLPPVGVYVATGKYVAYKPILQAIQEIAQASATLTDYVAFDIIPDVDGNLWLRTYTGTRGADRRFPNGESPLVFGSEYGTLAETSLTIDYTDEITYVVAGGQGDADTRLIVTVQDDDRIGATPWRRREIFLNASQAETSDELTNEAQTALRKGRPRLIFSGKVQQTSDLRYGRDYQWGDYITVSEFGYTLNARLDAIRVTVTQGEEVIEAYLRTEQYL